MNRPLLALLGLAVAGAAQLLAFALVGAGHGWVSPFFASLILFMTLPFALIRLADRVSLSPIPEAILLGIALIADIWLIAATIGEARNFQHMLETYPAFVLGWIAIWLSWQALASAALLSRLALRRRVTFLDTPVEPF